MGQCFEKKSKSLELEKSPFVPMPGIASTGWNGIDTESDEDEVSAECQLPRVEVACAMGVHMLYL